MLIEVEDGAAAGVETDMESSDVLRTTAYFSINSTLFISRVRPEVERKDVHFVWLVV